MERNSLGNFVYLFISKYFNHKKIPTIQIKIIKLISFHFNFDRNSCWYAGLLITEYAVQTPAKKKNKVRNDVTPLVMTIT